MQNAHFIQLHLLLVPLLFFPSLFFSLLFHSFTPSQQFSIPLLLAHQHTFFSSPFLFSTPFILIPLLLHSFLLFLLYILSAFFWVLSYVLKSLTEEVWSHQPNMTVTTHAAVSIFFFFCFHSRSFQHTLHISWHTRFMCFWRHLLLWVYY